MKYKLSITRKLIFKSGLVLIGLGVTFLLSTNLWIHFSTKNQVKEKLSSVKYTYVGLVLGTSKKLKSGHENPYFNARINAAVKLFKAGKIKHILVSGDNRSKYYNEPHDMQQALMGKGIPESAITLDYAGLRTLDSIVRCKEIFGQKAVTVITQKFHAGRAVYIGKYYGLETQSFVAASPPLRFSWKVKVREVLARPLAFLDLYVLNKKPRFKGDFEPIIEK